MDEEMVQGQRARLKEAIQALLALLPEEKRNQRAFEEEARRRAGLMGQAPELRVRLAAFDAAVNAAWLMVENSGLTASLVRTWRSRNRKRASWLDADTVGAEATFAMRNVLILYALSDGSVPLQIYAHQNIGRELDKLLARESGVPLDGARNADLARRSREVLGVVESIDDHEDAVLAESPEDAAIRAEDEHEHRA